MTPQRIVLAITGASGAVLGRKCLEIARGLPSAETHLVVTAAARKVILHELGEEGLADVLALAHVVHAEERIESQIASGSFDTAGMVIAPCSLHTAMAISAGLGTNLVERAAQVHLKERRPLCLLLRETPLAAHHLHHLADLASAGAVIMPASPRFYLAPENVEQLIHQMALKALGYTGLRGLVHPVYEPVDGLG